MVNGDLSMVCVTEFRHFIWFSVEIFLACLRVVSPILNYGGKLREFRIERNEFFDAS